MNQPTAEEPTQAVSPGADPTQDRSPGQADADMVDPAAAVDAEFIPGPDGPTDPDAPSHP